MAQSINRNSFVFNMRRQRFSRPFRPNAPGKTFGLLQYKWIVHLRQCLNRRDSYCALRRDHRHIGAIDISGARIDNGLTSGRSDHHCCGSVQVAPSSIHRATIKTGRWHPNDRCGSCGNARPGALAPSQRPESRWQKALGGEPL
jgi:hypothetical protein